MRGADTTDVSVESEKDTGDPATGQLAGDATGDSMSDRAFVDDAVGMGTSDVVRAALIRGKCVSVKGSENVGEFVGKDVGFSVRSTVGTIVGIRDGGEVGPGV